MHKNKRNRTKQQPVAAIDDNNDQKLTDTKNMTAPINDNIKSNITSFNELRNLTSASALADRLSIECDPTGVEMEPGEDISIDYTVENKISEPIEIVMECLGLEVQELNVI